MALLLDSFFPSSFQDSLSSSPLTLLKDSPDREATRSSPFSSIPSKNKSLSSDIFTDLVQEMLGSLYDKRPASIDSSSRLSPLSSTVKKQDKGNVKLTWLETPEAHVFKADLPGVKKEHIKLSPEGERGICISGERKKDVKNDGDKWHLLQVHTGPFRRSFELPEDANVAEMTAAFSDGILTVTVPKKEDNVQYVEIA